MPVQVRFRVVDANPSIAQGDTKKFTHPPTVSLSRVPALGERVYAERELEDVTWTVTDVVHRNFSADQIDAEVTIRRS